MFIYLYKVSVSCVKLHSQVGDWISSIPWHWRGLEPSPLMFSLRVPSWLSEQDFLPIWQGYFGRGLLHGGMPGVLTVSVFRLKVSPQKLMLRLVPLFHAPHSYKHAISRPKRGGVEVIMASHIFWTSLVWSVPLPPEQWHWPPHTPNPSTLHF